MAATDISTGSVQLQAPKDRPGAEQLEVLVVVVLEHNEPENEDASKWLLLTSYCQPTKTEALRSMQRYEGRRGIDDWFPVLKMGMRMEERHPFPTVVCRKRIHCAEKGQFSGIRAHGSRDHSVDGIIVIRRSVSF